MVSVVRRRPERRADMDGCWALENISSEWCRAEEGVALLEPGLGPEGSIVMQANVVDFPNSGLYSGAVRSVSMPAEKETSYKVMAICR